MLSSGTTSSPEPVPSVVIVTAVVVALPIPSAPVASTVPAPTKVKSLISSLVPSTRIEPASPPSFIVIPPVVPDTSNSEKSMTAAVPSRVVAPRDTPFVILALLTSRPVVNPALGVMVMPVPPPSGVEVARWSGVCGGR